MLPVQEINKQRDRRWIRVQCEVREGVSREEVGEVVGFRAEDVAVDLEGLLVASDEESYDGAVSCTDIRGVSWARIYRDRYIYGEKQITNLMSLSVQAAELDIVSLRRKRRRNKVARVVIYIAVRILFQDCACTWSNEDMIQFYIVSLFISLRAQG